MNRSALPCLYAARAAVFSLGLASLPALTGCSAMKVKLGWRLDLAKIPATTMEASLAGNPAIAPGEKSPLVIQIAASDGKTYMTEGKGHGKIMWKDLTATASVVSVNKKGIASLPGDPRLSEGKTGQVTITAPSHPGLQATFEIPLRYDYPFQASYSGASGASGMDGTNGLDGSSGSPGSLDPNNPSAGGDGGDGGNGGDGTNGTDGFDGPPMQVRVTMHPGAKPLLEAGVTTSNHKERYYLIDPQGGSITISSSGGDGGKGGAAGKGGRGGSGGIGQPNGMNGHDGLDGQPGRDGQDGEGGSITVFYDPQVQPYLAAIHTINPGGSKPVFQQQAIAALW